MKSFTDNELALDLGGYAISKNSKLQIKKPIVYDTPPIQCSDEVTRAFANFSINAQKSDDESTTVVIRENDDLVEFTGNFGI